MSLRDEVLRLIGRIRDLEDRVFELEQEYEEGPDQIGFEVDESEEFDEDASEY